jgi:predicted phosphodiesterase
MPVARGTARLSLAISILILTPAVLHSLDTPGYLMAPGDSAGFGPPPTYESEHTGAQTRTDIPGEDLLFSFAVIADSHVRVSSNDDYRYIKATGISRELLANFVADINDHMPPVDFAVHLGDVTDNGISSEFYWAGSIMDSLNCPFYPVVGNHDNFLSDGKQLWKDWCGLDSTHYTFDYFGIHFVVIDCTLQPYQPPYVECGSEERAWVEQDLDANWDRPTIILTHYNMWERGWCATFDTTHHYQEYSGVPELRQILEEAGNVIAVLNGHVHANRVEVHNGIYYIDVNATLVGRPSIRYFYVYPGRIAVDYAYISDAGLFNHVAALCQYCISCFNPDSVCAFVDGSEADKRFTIEYSRPPGGGVGVPAPAFTFILRRGDSGGWTARIESAETGPVSLSLYDVRGRRLGRSWLWKDGETMTADLMREFPAMARLSKGVYFLSASFRGRRHTLKMPLF